MKKIIVLFICLLIASPVYAGFSGGFSGGGGGGGTGDVATDTIWNAAGDLAIGTGSNTASVLPIATPGTVVRSSTTASAPEYTPYTFPTTIPTTGKALISNGANFVESTALGAAAYTATTDYQPAGSYQASHANLDALSSDFQRGDILYYGASGWTRLASAATAGYVLIQGTNDPTWSGSMSFSVLNMGSGTYTALTSPYVKVPEIIASVDKTLVATEAYSAIINNYGQVNHATVAMPTLEYGMNGIVTLGTSTSATWALTAPHIYYNDDTATCSRVAITAAQGASLSFWTFKTGASSWYLVVRSIRGTWATSAS